MEPTAKMINFAKIISEMLKIQLPDLTNYKDTHEFINNNSKAYWEMVNVGEENLELLKFKIDKIKDNYLKINYKLSSNFISNLDEVKNLQGIYILWSGKNLVYIGKSINLKSRIISSIYERNSLQLPITSVSYINTLSTADMHILEPLLITEYKPILNTEFACQDFSNHFKSNIDILEVFRKRIPIIENEKDYCINDKF